MAYRLCLLRSANTTWCAHETDFESVELVIVTVAEQYAGYVPVCCAICGPEARLAEAPDCFAELDDTSPQRPTFGLHSAHSSGQGMPRDPGGP